jgi:hypothetical protein
MKTVKPNTRRNFLLAAGLGGAGAVAAVAIARKEPEVVAGAEPAASKAGGYRTTPHILKYYKTTEV